MLTFECPTASRTSASVRPPAKAWLMKVWRPWWMVRNSSRSSPKTLHAVRNRFRRVCRESAWPLRPGRVEAMNGWSAAVPWARRSLFHADRSASVPASHQSGTARGRPPLEAPERTRRWGRADSARTSSNRSLAISLARRPQHAARRNTARLSRVPLARGALRSGPPTQRPVRGE